MESGKHASINATRSRTHHIWTMRYEYVVSSMSIPTSVRAWCYDLLVRSRIKLLLVDVHVFDHVVPVSTRTRIYYNIIPNTMYMNYDQ